MQRANWDIIVYEHVRDRGRSFSRLMTVATKLARAGWRQRPCGLYEVDVGALGVLGLLLSRLRENGLIRIPCDDGEVAEWLKAAVC